ncbi:hypothetical protein D9M71_646830 [compost metagenome]
MNKLYTLAFASLISSCAATPSYATPVPVPELRGELIATRCFVADDKITPVDCLAVVDIGNRPKAFATDKHDYSGLVGTTVVVTNRGNEFNDIRPSE